MTIPQYPAYKDSGVEWLGEIPAHWDIFRMGTIFRHVADEGSENLPILSVSIHDGVSDKELDENEMDRQVSRSDDRTKYKEVQPGDLVYNMMRAWQGGFGSVSIHGMVSPAYVVARPIKEFSTRFVEMLLRTPQAVEQMRRLSRGVTDFRLRLYWEEFKTIRIVLPPAHDELAIAAFLDIETRKIDSLVEEQRRLIELLKEKRQAVISHAVTKGLDPDAPMKPSGIEWLGNVPRNWNVKLVRHACEIENTLRTPIDAQTRIDIAGDYPYYGPTGILSWIDDYRIEGEYFLLGEDGDHFLKFHKQPMTIHVEGKFNVNNHAHVIRGVGACSTKWACLYFAHKDLLPWLIKQGVGRFKLRKETLRTIPIVIPPQDEQQMILKVINENVLKITRLITEAENAIDLLQERRTSLISAAVTGKIDVRGLAKTEAA